MKPSIIPPASFTPPDFPMPAGPHYRYLVQTPKTITLRLADLAGVLPEASQRPAFSPYRSVTLPCDEIFSGAVPKIRLARLAALAPDSLTAEGLADTVVALPAGRLAKHFQFLQERILIEEPIAPPTPVAPPPPVEEKTPLTKDDGAPAKAREPENKKIAPAAPPPAATEPSLAAPATPTAPPVAPAAVLPSTPPFPASEKSLQSEKSPADKAPPIPSPAPASPVASLPPPLPSPSPSAPAAALIAPPGIPPSSAKPLLPSAAESILLARPAKPPFVPAKKPPMPFVAESGTPVAESPKSPASSAASAAPEPPTETPAPAMPKSRGIFSMLPIFRRKEAPPKIVEKIPAEPVVPDIAKPVAAELPASPPPIAPAASSQKAPPLAPPSSPPVVESFAKPLPKPAPIVATPAPPPLGVPLPKPPAVPITTSKDISKPPVLEPVVVGPTPATVGKDIPKPPGIEPAHAATGKDFPKLPVVEAISTTPARDIPKLPVVESKPVPAAPEPPIAAKKEISEKPSVGSSTVRLIETEHLPKTITPSTPPADSPGQEGLQSLFLTEEYLSVDRVLELCSGLPGITSCVLARESTVVAAHNVPDSIDLVSLSAHAMEMLRAMRASSAKMGLGVIPAVTIHSEKGPVSFFNREDLCLCVLHKDRGFVPGVREKLHHVLIELSRSPLELPIGPGKPALKSGGSRQPSR